MVCLTRICLWPLHTVAYFSFPTAAFNHMVSVYSLTFYLAVFIFIIERITHEDLQLEKRKWGRPWGPVAETPNSQSRGPGFNLVGRLDPTRCTEDQKIPRALDLAQPRK